MRPIIEGMRQLSRGTIDTIFEEQLNGVDPALGIPPSLALGFALPQQKSMPYIPGGTIRFRAC